MQAASRANDKALAADQEIRKWKTAYEQKNLEADDLKSRFIANA